MALASPMSAAEAPLVSTDACENGVALESSASGDSRCCCWLSPSSCSPPGLGCSKEGTVCTVTTGRSPWPGLRLLEGSSVMWFGRPAEGMGETPLASLACMALCALKLSAVSDPARDSLSDGSLDWLWLPLRLPDADNDEVLLGTTGGKSMVLWSPGVEPSDSNSNRLRPGGRSI